MKANGYIPKSVPLGGLWLVNTWPLCYNWVKEVVVLQEILAKVRGFVLDAMGENDPAHDGDHVQRVVKTALEICRAYPGANLFRTQLLAWLHDMNDDKLDSNVGLGAVTDLLRSIGTPEADIAFVAEGLPYISYRKHPKLGAGIPLEIRIVQDADRIDAMGAIGIARTFAYGGARGRTLENSLAHFDEKLLRLYDLLSTQEGKRLAKPRHDFLCAFYAQFRAENE